MSKKNWLILFIIFVLLRLILFNINIAEFGDSYDFFRLAEAITRGEYPLDAKRLPVFPALIAFGLPVFGAVLWAKIVVLFATLANLVLVIKLADKLFPKSFSDNDFLVLGLVFLFCPVILYWWVRIVAAPIFAFWILVVLNIFYDSPHTLTKRVAVLSARKSITLNRVLIWVYTLSATARRGFLRLALLGSICGLAAMTRYEGFLLFAAIGLGLLVQLISETGRLIRFSAVVRQIFSPLILYSLFFLLIVSPWFIRNYVNFGQIFYTPYAEDPAGFVNDLYTRFQWLYYFLFMFGFPFGIWAFFRGVWASRRNWLAYLPLYLFTFFSILLFFVWAPSARFYSYLVPFLLPFVVFGLRTLSEAESVLDSFAFLVLLVIYFFGVWHFRFYFLGAGKVFKLLALLLGGTAVAAELLKFFVPGWQKYSFRVLVLLALLIQVVTSVGIIKNNRVVYASVHKAVNDRLAQTAQTIAYYDETGVSNWYLRSNGIYYNQALTLEEQLEWLKHNNVDYVLWTNEHNEEQELTVVKHSDYSDYFEPAVEYSYHVGEQELASTIYKFVP